MRKIAVVINNLGFGGAERVVVDEVNELYRRGVDVRLITLRSEPDSSYAGDLRIPDDRRTCIAFPSLLHISSWRTLIAFMRMHRFDMVVTHLWFANTVGRVVSRLVSVKTVVAFEHNVYDRVKTPQQFIVDRFLQRWTTRVAAVSEAVRDSLITHGIDKEKIVVIDNGIELSRYSNAGSSEIRVQLGIGDETLILFVGRLIAQKGVDVLIDALSRLPSGRLCIVGDGVMRKGLEAQAKKMGVAARVAFLGKRSDVPSLMKSSDCLVLPSRWEGLGLVIPEAFAVGLPVVTTDFPAALAMITSGENGIVVPKDDPERLAQAIEQMLDRNFRKRLAAAALGSAARFSIQRHIDTLLSYAA